MHRRYALNVLALAPSLYLRLGESGGVAAADSSGNGLDGVYQGSPTLGAAGAILGDENTAVTLNGTTQYITVADDPLLDPGDTFTLMAWVKFITSLAGEIILHKGTNGYQLSKTSGGGLLNLEKVGVASIVTSTIPIPVGVWVHLAATKAAGVSKLYINGVDVTGAVTDQTIAATAIGLGVGATVSGGAPMAGSLDELAIFPTALSAADIQSLYADGLAGRRGEVPVYGVLLASLHLVAPTYRFVSATVPDGDASWSGSPEILVVDSIEREVDPRESRFTIATFRFTLIDIAGVATPYMPNVVGRECSLYTLDYESSWDVGSVRLFTGIVTEFDLVDGGYTITARSTITLADKQLFNSGRTQVQTGIGTTDSAVIVEDASDYATEGVLIINSERIAYSGVVDNGATWTIQNLIRGQYGSVAAAHAAGDSVVETFVLGPDHPYDILLAILDGAADSKTGLGMSDYSSFAQYALAKAIVGNDIEMQFEVQGPVNAKDWLETELFRPTAAYPRDNAAGAILVKPLSTAGTTVGTLADADSLQRARWIGNFPLRVNHVTFLYDYDPVIDDYLSSHVVKDDGLIAMYGIQPIVIESKGIHTGLTDTDVLIEDRGRAYISRFGLELPTISVETIFRKRNLEAGDDVATTFSNLINVTLGEIGLSNAPAELITVRHRLSDGRMEFVMISHQPIFDVLAPDTLAAGLVSYPTVTVA